MGKGRDKRKRQQKKLKKHAEKMHEQQDRQIVQEILQSPRSDHQISSTINTLGYPIENIEVVPVSHTIN